MIGRDTRCLMKVIVDEGLRFANRAVFMVYSAADWHFRLAG